MTTHQKTIPLEARESKEFIEQLSRVVVRQVFPRADIEVDKIKKLASQYVPLLSPYIAEKPTALQLVFIFEIQRLMQSHGFPKGAALHEVGE